MEFIVNYQQILNLIDTHFKNRAITEQDMPLFKTYFSQPNIIALLHELAQDDKALEIIASRSYLHALGFYKIVLVDSVKDLQGPKEKKAQLRLHIWKPESEALPIVESLHEHSFDFISTVISGKIENQCFIKENLNEYEKQTLNKLLVLLPQLTHQQMHFLDRQAELILGFWLEDIGSLQAGALNYKHELNMPLLQTITGFDMMEIKDFAALQGFYKSNRVSGEKKAYKHILERYLNLKPHHVFSVNEGEYYYHPYQYPHRLYYDSSRLNATMLVTTSVAENEEGGSFQRPTYEQSGAQNYKKISISADELQFLILDFLQTLE